MTYPKLHAARGPDRARRLLPWRRLLLPSLFFAGVIYYEEIFLKLYCFQSITPAGALFTLLFTLPAAALLGLLCGGVSPKKGRVLLPLCTGLLSLWLGSQAIYYHLFKTFMTIFSLTKMFMVAQSFGGTVITEVLINWFPILMMTLPLLASIFFRKRLILDQPQVRGLRLRWAGMAALLQLAAMCLVMLCNTGPLSLRYIYMQSATPDLEVQNFGMLTQTQLEVRRVVFGLSLIHI